MITVLMPTYNNAEYVETAVRSILAQSFADFEFLIIDDCSTDNTVDIIKSFSDTRIRLIINTENTGLGNTLNKGLAEARYELVGEGRCEGRRRVGDGLGVGGRTGGGAGSDHGPTLRNE